MHAILATLGHVVNLPCVRIAMPTKPVIQQAAYAIVLPCGQHLEVVQLAIGLVNALSMHVDTAHLL